MNIVAHIRELLFGHDCVIVPGFGGFIGNYIPARIDQSTGTFFPPVKQISFNRNLNHNDGLLIKKISGSAGINYGDTKSMIEEFVSDLRRKLEQGEKVTFDSIGTFMNNQEGNVQFEPDINVNYHLDSYGLETFQCFPLEEYDLRKRIVKGISKDPVKHASFRRNIRRAAVIIPIAGILIAVSLNTDLLRSKVEETTMNPLVNAELEYNKAAVDSEIKTDAGTITTPVAEAVTEQVPLSDPPPPEVVAPVVSEAVSYYIIIGSFKSEENAAKMAAQMESEGFTPEIVQAANGFYRVGALISDELSIAVSRKDSIAKKFPGAWISRKR